MRLGFVGAGNMAGALARGIAARCDPPPEMLFADSGSGRAQVLADELGGARAGDLAELAAGSDAIVLAVKPNALAEAATGLVGFGGPLVSLLGATSVADLERAFPEASVLRTMPNIAVEIGRGVICHAPPGDREATAPVLEILAAVATLVELDEVLLDPATAVMGCGPGFLAMVGEALATAGSEAGLGPELSGRLVALAAAGTGELLLSHDPGALQRAIASPGGSTEAGLEELADRRVPEAFSAAVKASLERMAGVR